jgi:uncharacterized protein
MSRRWFKRTVVFLLTWYVGTGVGLMLLQRSLIYFPDARRVTTENFPKGVFQRVAVEADSEVAWWCSQPPQTPITNLWIIYFHGNSGNITDRLGKARTLEAMGFPVCLLEYRGYGGNKGSPNERGFQQDACRLLTTLFQAGLKPGQMIFYGESLGAGIAVQMATEFPPARLILESPYTSLWEVAKVHYPVLTTLYPSLIQRDRFDNAAKLASIRAPLLLLHARHDTVIPIAHTQALQ